MDYRKGQPYMSRLVRDTLIKRAKKISRDTTEYKSNLERLEREWYEQERQRLKERKSYD